MVVGDSGTPIIDTAKRMVRSSLYDGVHTVIWVITLDLFRVNPTE